MSSNYEMMYILRPDLSDELVTESINKYLSFLNERGIENIQLQNRGKRRLAYPIGKYLDGIYVQMNYQADGSQVAPLERMMRLGEDVIRYLTIKLKKGPVAEGETKTEFTVPDEEV
jgi:small subunit ribosomal protein S6